MGQKESHGNVAGCSPATTGGLATGSCTDDGSKQQPGTTAEQPAAVQEAAKVASLSQELAVALRLLRNTADTHTDAKEDVHANHERAMSTQRAACDALKRDHCQMQALLHSASSIPSQHHLQQGGKLQQSLEEALQEQGGVMPEIAVPDPDCLQPRLKSRKPKET